MNFILYDGLEWSSLLPLTFTRPVSEIRIGLFTMKERWEKYIKKNIDYVITKPFLSDKYSKNAKNNFKDVLLVNSSYLPNEELVDLIFYLKIDEAICYNDKIVAVRKNVFFYDKNEKDIYNKIEKITYKKNYELKKIIHIKNTWDIFIYNKIILEKDFLFYTKNRKSFSLLGSNNILLYKEKIFLEEELKTNNIVLNAKYGPIYIDSGVDIMEGSVIRGPSCIGKMSTLNIGCKIYGGTTIGPYCKISGEIVDTVIFSYSNKTHDGFLGNSVLGEWCNLGAGTNVSNLRNDYSKVTVWSYEKKKFISTDIQFFGIIMGDHSKSAINTQFNTATVVGVGANIFGFGFAPRYIPSFSLGAIQNNSNKMHFHRICETASIVMNRRNVHFSILEKNILKYLYNNRFCENL
ncbi:putative sugar nucleotidyl transferase [Blattabacterium cuenoti]|uniref:putative sugar nucleotidyl transferase n=1 Tax=Blattabacterium cuenoti TaxID=1653831 RepID=UPI00163C903B|nr:putative sugar nucleotidyl transferase [Blattabacterium cuenoti]